MKKLAQRIAKKYSVNYNELIGRGKSESAVTGLHEHHSYLYPQDICHHSDTFYFIEQYPLIFNDLMLNGSKYVWRDEGKLV